jgi:hypothetical protein
MSAGAGQEVPGLSRLRAVNQSPKSVCRGQPAGDAMIPALHGGFESVQERFCDQLLFGIEVAVKAAMCQTRRLHQIGDAYPVDSSLADQFRRILDDQPAMRFSLFFGGTWHGRLRLLIEG